MLVPSYLNPTSISFTSIAGGNAPADVCAASASNMLGVVTTPALAMIILGKQGRINAHAIESIMLQLLAPFALEQILQRWIRSKLVCFAERVSIVAVAYLAFSNAICWRRLEAG